MTATPAIVGRLFDGHQLVKRIVLDHAPTVIQTNDMPPPRLRELDASFGERATVPFSIWEHSAWTGTDYLDIEEWMLEFGPQHPPVTSVVNRTDRPPVVVVRYADYQRQGGKLG